MIEIKAWHVSALENASVLSAGWAIGPARQSGTYDGRINRADRQTGQLRMLKLMQASIMIAMWGCFSSTAIAGSKKIWHADAGRGLKLADTLCSGCHIVSPKQKRGAIAGIPTFRGIANLPGQTDQHIGNTLVKPHPPMPNTQLTRREIADLLAYFGTLRKVKPGTPAKQDNAPSRPKPIYPSAS